MAMADFVAMMPAGFRELLDRKYDILQQQADAGTTSAGASKTAAEATASIAPSTVSENLSRAGYYSAQAADIPLMSESVRDLNAAQALGLRAEAQTKTPYTEGQIAGATFSSLGMPSTKTSRPVTLEDVLRSSQTPTVNLEPTKPLSKLGTDDEGQGFAKGIAKVPGKGDGTKDTVPAKLAPGEAVLNKAAAQSMGRGLIAALNAAGARKMGMV